MALDLTLGIARMCRYPDGTSFRGDTMADGFACHEMRRHGKWLHQIDYYALVATVHLLMHAATPEAERPRLHARQVQGRFHAELPHSELAQHGHRMAKPANRGARPSAAPFRDGQGVDTQLAALLEVVCDELLNVRTADCMCASTRPNLGQMAARLESYAERHRPELMRELARQRAWLAADSDQRTRSNL